MLNKENIRAVLFDIDGTLTDTEPLGIATMHITLKEIGIQISETEEAFFDKVWRRDGTDITTEEFIHQILQSYKPDTNEIEFTQQFYDKYEQTIIKAALLPGAKELLKHLKEHYKLALVTASKQSQAQVILKQHDWQDMFDVVVSQDEYKIKKPDPASFLMVSGRLSVPLEFCVVVEDSKNGVQAGKNAGAYVFGVRAGNKHPQNLSVADEVVDTLNDLINKL